jgi:hypothetical protein
MEHEWRFGDSRKEDSMRTQVIVPTCIGYSPIAPLCKANDDITPLSTSASIQHCLPMIAASTPFLIVALVIC